ncbi:hypothetical protein OIU78_023065 [Salix suchowensis]|nr:hypothetical protein OIU78_023065 [Salix suchowensis]
MRSQFQTDGFIRYLTTRIPLFSNLVPPPPRTPVRFGHDTFFLLLGEPPSTFFLIRETALGDLFFPFWKIQERNNQPIDIGRSKGFFQCIISGSNGIHRYRKKPCQIEIFSFDHLSIVNTI